MRGHLQPGRRLIPNEEQAAFAALARGRRTKLAKAAQTSLLKADQWARGEAVAAEVAVGLAKGLATLKAKAKK